MMVGMGKKTSVWLTDDLAEAVKTSGVPIAELIRRGLGADSPDPLEDRLAAVVRAEFEARFRAGEPVTVKPGAKGRKATEYVDVIVDERQPPGTASLISAGTDADGKPVARVVHMTGIASDPEPPPPAIVTPSLRRASDLPATAACPHKGTRITRRMVRAVPG